MQLPERPSKEHLRKQAKRLAKALAIRVSQAQHKLALEYGFSTWADLMRRVDDVRGDHVSPLSDAAGAGDVAAVRRLLLESQPIEGVEGEAAPLWRACAADADPAARIEIAGLLLEAGANVRRSAGAGSTPLHAAATRGPLALVEALIRWGALEWQTDAKGRSPVDAARNGSAADKAAIIELLDRPVIRDPAFRRAVKAIHAGDERTLAQLIDAEPRLLKERIVEPDCYRESGRHQYFLDPKLFWFVANNPILVEPMPRNIVRIAQIMIDRGVDQADLDTTLGLTITGAAAREQGHQIPLIKTLIAAGARVDEKDVDAALGHREIDAVEALLAAGQPLTLAIAAATGRMEAFETLLAAASSQEIQKAFGMAALNSQNQIVRRALSAGADPNAFLPVHQHSTALHQAAIDENVDLMALLIDHGGRTDIADLLWDGVALDWARHANKARAIAFLSRTGPDGGEG